MSMNISAAERKAKIEQLKKQKDGKIAFEKFETTRED